MTTNITKRVAEVEKVLNEKTLAREAYKVFRENTPYASGNAFRKTILKDNTIEARYPYAQRLDEGYSSKKPEGMSKPTLDFIRKWIKQKLG
jgi:hypothetical protein